MLYNYVCGRDLNSKYARDVVLLQVRLYNHNKNIFIPHNRKQMQLNLSSLSTNKIVLEMEVFITKFILF
jgi:hypothetical protein